MDVSNVPDVALLPHSQAGGLDRRFDRFARLIGEAQLQRLQQAHVMVVGIGGVGSWAVESLVRSGIGTLTLVDFDDVCITNFNRQLHALHGRIGQPKADVMAERLRQINPAVVVQVQGCFYGEQTAEAILATRPDFVVDAIDCVSAKCHLLATCHARGMRVVCSTGSGGRLDPTSIVVADLARTDVDPLARTVRKVLRQEYGFPREKMGDFGIPAVYSRETPLPPRELPSDGGSARRCFCTSKNSEFFNCDDRHVILGSAAFVTGAFGLHCAAVVVRGLLAETPAIPGDC